MARHDERRRQRGSANLRGDVTIKATVRSVRLGVL